MDEAQRVKSAGGRQEGHLAKTPQNIRHFLFRQLAQSPADLGFCRLFSVASEEQQEVCGWLTSLGVSECSINIVRFSHHYCCL